MRYSLLALAATTILSGASARGHAHRRHAHAHAELAPRFEATANTPDECVCSTYVTSYLVDYTPAPLPPAVANATTTVQSIKTVVPIHEVDATSSVVPSVLSSIVPTGVSTSAVVPSILSSIVPTGVSTSAVVPSSSEEITTTYSSTWVSTYTSTAMVTVTAVSSAPIASVPSSTLVSASSPAPAPPANVPTPAVTTIATPGVYTIPATTITLTRTEAVCVPETTSLAPGTQTYGGVTTIVETSTTVVCPLATVTVENGVTTSKIYTTTYICPSAGTYTIGATTSTVTGTITVPCEYPVPTAYPPGTYTQPEVITTITVTSQVVTCPFLNAGPTTTAAAIATTTAVPPVVHTSTIVASSAPATTTHAVVVSSASPSSSSSAAPVQTTTPGAGPWAVTYSPYDDNGSCKSASDVASDIADIASKGISNVRIYSTDCSGLQNVGDACEKHGIGMIMGIFIKSGGVHTGDSQVTDLIAWGKWNQIVMLVVGNEAIFNGYCTAEELAAYISSVGSQVKAAGYTGLITTTEPLNILQANAGALCGVLDVVGCNIHPFFNSQVTADKAGEFLAGQLQLAEAACNGKSGWVLEAGWPSSGQANGLAVPGKSEQATAIAAIMKAVPGKIAMFTYRNDLWKASGAYGVEQSFGCGDLL